MFLEKIRKLRDSSSSKLDESIHGSVPFHIELSIVATYGMEIMDLLAKSATRLKVTQKATESAVLNISLRDKTNLRDRQAWRRRTSRSGWAIAEEEEEEKNKIFIYLTYPFTFMGVFMDSLPHIIHLISSPVIPFFLRALIVTLPTL